MYILNSKSLHFVVVVVVVVGVVAFRDLVLRTVYSIVDDSAQELFLLSMSTITTQFVNEL